MDTKTFPECKGKGSELAVFENNWDLLCWVLKGGYIISALSQEKPTSAPAWFCILIFLFKLATEANENCNSERNESGEN